MAGSRSNKQKGLPPQSPVQGLPAKSLKVTGECLAHSRPFFLPTSVPGTKRPKRSTQGQGGAIAQLQKVGEKITDFGPVADHKGA